MISDKCPKCGELKEANSPGLFACRSCNHQFSVGLKKVESKDSPFIYILVLVFCCISILLILSNIHPIVSILTALAYFVTFGYFIVYNIIRDSLSINVTSLIRLIPFSLFVGFSLYDSLFN